MYSCMDTCKLLQVGSPIRKSAGYRIFAPNRSLSQLVTSFVGSWCQVILPTLFLTWPVSIGSRKLYKNKSLSSLKLKFYPKYPLWISRKNLSTIKCIFSYAGFVTLNVSFPLYLSYLSSIWCLTLFSFQGTIFEYELFISAAANASAWWRWGESNSWPPACKAGALPAELHPHRFLWWA